MVEYPLFVYGTLLREFTPGGPIGEFARFDAKTRGKLYDLPAGYPALLPVGSEWVHGELTQKPVPENILRLLDVYEGVAEGLYRRVLVDVHAHLRSTVAWAFVMDDPAQHQGVLLASGRWRPRRRR